MTRAQTSDRISRLAGRYIRITTDQLASISATPAGSEQLKADVRSLAASVLRQDETPRKPRGLIARILNQ